MHILIISDNISWAKDLSLATPKFQNGREYTGDYNQLVYLRTRYYAPGMGRFLTKDTWAGHSNQPLSFNKWNYTTANPINLIDPSGMIAEKDNIPALIIAEGLRIDYDVNILVDWGYMNWLPRDLSGIPVPNFHCNEWQYGNWRSLNELRWVENGIHLLATKMGGPAKFKAAMKNRPVEIERVKKLPSPFTDNTGLALPEIPIYFMVDGLALPDSPFDIGELRATYTTIHELGHVWDIRSGLRFSIEMATTLGNVKNGQSTELFGCLFQPGSSNLAIRYRCGLKYWEYYASNEPAPGDLTQPYAASMFTEDWAEAVAYTVYPEYGNSMKYNEIGPIRKIFVEMMMRDIQ